MIVNRCLDYWPSLLLTVWYLNQNTPPACYRTLGLQSHSRFHYSEVHRIQSWILTVPMFLVQAVYVHSLRLLHTPFIATGESSTMLSCVQCLGVGVLFPLFQDHQPRGVGTENKPPRLGCFKQCKICKSRWINYLVMSSFRAADKGRRCVSHVCQEWRGAELSEFVDSLLPVCCPLIFGTNRYGLFFVFGCEFLFW